MTATGDHPRETELIFFEPEAIAAERRVSIDELGRRGIALLLQKLRRGEQREDRRAIWPCGPRAFRSELHMITLEESANAARQKSKNAEQLPVMTGCPFFRT